MLADDILTWIDTDHSRKSGLPSNPSNRIVQAALESAACYVFDDAATEAAQSVAYTYPSTILQALDLARLPAKTVWIEWPETTRDKYRRQHPDRHYEFDGTSTPKRVGLLLNQLGETRAFTIRCLYADMPDCNIGFGHMIFDPEFEATEKLLAEMRKGVTPMALAGRNRPGEADAYVRLLAKFRYEIPESVQDWLTGVVSPMDNPQQRLSTLILQDQRDVMPECIFAIALILLLNTRNGMSHTERDVTKLNRARAKAKKRPLLDFKMSKLLIGRRARAAMSAAAASAGSSKMSHWTRGHFKVRQTGVFWWNCHLRGNADLGYKAPRFLVSTNSPVRPAEVFNDGPTTPR